jgi:hypothetical protein
MRKHIDLLLQLAVFFLEQRVHAIGFGQLQLHLSKRLLELDLPLQLRLCRIERRFQPRRFIVPLITVAKHGLQLTLNVESGCAFLFDLLTEQQDLFVP